MCLLTRTLAKNRYFFAIKRRLYQIDHLLCSHNHHRPTSLLQPPSSSSIIIHFELPTFSLPAIVSPLLSQQRKDSVLALHVSHFISSQPKERFHQQRTEEGTKQALTLYHIHTV
jgi:hypothetical protein